MNIQFSPGAQAVRSLTETEDFSISLIPSVLAVGSSGSGPETIKDITYSVTNTAVTQTFNSFSINVPLSAQYSVGLSNLTPSVADVLPDGTVVPKVSYGNVAVEFSSRFTKRSATSIISTTGAGKTYDSILSYTTGSLRDYLDKQQAAALVGVTPGAASQRAGVNGNGIAAGLASVVQMPGSFGGANTNNFLRAQGKSGFDGFNLPLLDEVLDSGFSGNGAGWRAWISPHHFLTWIGHGATSASGRVAIQEEIVVMYSATPWGGALAKLLPSNYRSYMDVIAAKNWLNIGTGIGCWARLYNTYDGKGDASAERRWVQPGMLHTGTKIPSSRAAFQVRAEDGTLVNGGDSGSPVFVGIHGDLVMLSHCQSQYNLGSIFYADYITEINVAMNTLAAAASDPLAGSYAVQTVDLSGFTSYA